VADWRVSPILAPAIAEIRARYAGIVIGTIGDQAHRAEESDHNPDRWGFVCAADPMIGGSFTAAACEQLFQLLVAMIRRGDKRVAYVIHGRRICSSTVQPGVIRTYTGTDPHTGHLHLSVPHGANPHPTSRWGIYDQPEDDDMADVTTIAKVPALKAIEDGATNGVLAYGDDAHPGGGLPTFLGEDKNLLNYLEWAFDTIRSQGEQLQEMAGKLDQLLARTPQ
jgi:hypothetical protein